MKNFDRWDLLNLFALVVFLAAFFACLTRGPQ